jgi:MOSC domain-containing protein
MMGEELNAVEVTKGGLVGDRVYLLIDNSDRKIASAKNPRKWPQLFDFRAALADDPRISGNMPPVRITLPDGTVVNSEHPDVHQILSRVLKREVTLSPAAGLSTATAEEYWPDIEGLDHRDTVTDFGLPDGTFFDCAFRTFVDNCHCGSAADFVFAGALRSATVSPKHCGGDCEQRERLCGECLGREDPVHRE